MSDIKEIEINETVVFIKDVEFSNQKDSLLNITSLEQVRFDSFKCNKRRATFLGVRSIVKEFWPSSTIEYNNVGAPTLSDQPDLFISISHSQYLCAIAKNSKNPIGLDIEIHSGQATRLRSRFTHADEEAFLSGELEDTLLWSAKESLYKIAGVKKLIFKEQLRITAHDRTQQRLNGFVRFHDNRVQKYRIDYRIMGDIILTLATPEN